MPASDNRGRESKTATGLALHCSLIQPNGFFWAAMSSPTRVLLLISQIETVSALPTSMTTWTRVHCTDTEAIVTQHSDGWRMQINFREPNHNPVTITGYLFPSVDRTNQIADNEVSRYGHVCTGGCQDWVELP
jgi:hypothetical protein